MERESFEETVGINEQLKTSQKTNKSILASKKG